MRKTFLQYLLICINYFFSMCISHTSYATLNSSFPTRRFTVYSPTIVPRIVGGYRCPIRDHPYMVSIRTTQNLKHYCGGTLVSKFWVLTAGRCCPETYQIGSFTAVLGSSYANSIDYQLYLIVAVYTDYYNDSFNHDIGLMELEGAVTTDRSVQYVRLSRFSQKEESIAVACSSNVVLGWGDQHPNARYDSHLQCVTLQYLTWRECAKYYLSIPVNTMCAHTQRKGTCQGDYGGPLLCNGVQYGVLSFAGDCNYEPYPVVYTRVDMYEEFLQRASIDNKGACYLLKGVNICILMVYLILLFVIL